MPEKIIYSQDQLVFINSSYIRGIQDVNFQYNVNYGQLKTLGLDKTDFALQGAQVGQVSISSIMIGNDPFIALTGANSCNIYLLNNKFSSGDNYSSTTGYLSTYRSSCSVDDIPQIQGSFVTFGEMGNVSTLNNQDFSLISSSLESNIVPISFKNISIYLDNFLLENVISYDLSVNIPRRPDFEIGSRYPCRVNINYPIEIDLSLTISTKDYKAYNLRRYPTNKSISDIQITIKDNNSSTINDYIFDDMNLVSENYNAQVNSKSTVTLLYKKFLNKKPPLVKGDIVLYLNSRHQKSAVVGSLKWNDLSLNSNNYTFSNIDFVSHALKMENNEVLNPVNSNIFINSSASFLFESNLLNSGTSQTILSWNNGSNKVLLHNTGGGIILTVNGTDYEFGSNSTLSTLQYISITINDSTKIAKLYINGDLVSSVAYTGSINYTGLVYIGAKVVSGTDTLNILGNLYKVLIYNRCLSAEEILQNYKNMSN